MDDRCVIHKDAEDPQGDGSPLGGGRLWLGVKALDE